MKNKDIELLISFLKQHPVNVEKLMKEFNFKSRSTVFQWKVRKLLPKHYRNQIIQFIERNI